MPRLPRSTKPATKATSHAGKVKGDTSYNARRRYTRAAQRNLEKAEATTGATAARYRGLAKQDLENALKTYDKNTTQDFSQPIKDLASSLDVNLNKSRQQLKQTKTEVANRMRNAVVERSISRLEGELQDSEVRRQAEARILFNSPVGQRVIGGLVDVWKDKAVEIGADGKPIVNKSKMMEAIFDYFGTNNLADILEKIEKVLGESLYRQGGKDEIYEVVKLQIQNKVADNTLVA